jgi:hypothetical protein
MGRARSGKQGKGQRERTARVLAERERSASEMARSPTRTVTLRIPAALNEWLDAYRHLSYPERVGKQELVVEGLVMAYLRRGRPREPVLDSAEVVRRRVRLG